MALEGNSVAKALQLDNQPSLNRFVRTVKSLSEDAHTLHLFEHRNNLFSVHGHAQTQLAKQLASNYVTQISELPSVPPLPTVYFNFRVSKNLIRATLFTVGRKVSIWTVPSDGRPTVRAKGSPAHVDDLDHWLDDEASQEAIVSNSCTNNTVLAIRFGRAKNMLRIGVVLYDNTHRILSTNELYEDESFSMLERLLVATNAKEVICCDGDVAGIEAEKLAEVSEHCQAALTVLDKRQFSASNLSIDLERLLGSAVKAAGILDCKLASSATAGVIEYLSLLSDPKLESKISLEDLDITGYMHLDSNAMRALNILPYHGDGGKNGSLLSLLNRTKNPVGGRLLRKWLTQPLQSEKEINQRLDIVSTFVDLPELLESVRDDHLAKLPDIEIICRRFKVRNGAKASLQDAVRLYQCSVRLPFMCDIVSGHVDNPLLKERYIKPLLNLTKELANFEALVETTIDLDQVDNGEFVVSPTVNAELQKLRERQDAVLAKINSEYESVNQSIFGMNGDSLKLERKDNLGYIFRLTRKEEKHIRGKRQYVVLETRKDGVRFQTARLRKLSREYQEIADQYADMEKEMRIKTLEVAGTYVEVFLDVAALLAEMDVLASFAFIATHSRSQYVRPKIKPPGSGLVIKQGRHPIVEENMPDDVDFIPNDLNLTRSGSAETPSENSHGGQFVVVTGPNMGGKSTYIRSAGVLTVMAHVGSYIPAHEAEVPVTDRIFTRVGAGDNQHRAISTFMSEMLETAAILRSASNNSLIIIDELGRGTGTTEGYGLAYAISKHIAMNIKAPCLFATHFFELTDLPKEIPTAQNVHVTASTDPKTNKLTFLYEVAPGGCDQSFGVHVAEMANFPPPVVQLARRKADELEGHMSSSKRRRVENISEEDMEEGHRKLQKFIDYIRKLPMDTAQAKTQAMKDAQAARDALICESNSYIRSLLNQSKVVA